MSQPSIKKNAILSSVKTVLSIMVPLVTIPYVSRTLLVDAVGKHNFAVSVVSYFILLADLGIFTYAIREGSRLRESRADISRFASEIFSFHTISATVSFALLMATSFFLPTLKEYRILILILAIQIPLSVFSRAWLYNVFEEFGVVTLLQALFQVLSVALLILTVHSPNDLYKYTLTYLISASGANIVLGLHSKKLADIKIISIKDLKPHIKPIFIIFSTTLTVTIYVNSDITILGLLVGDEAVGLYSTSVKVYNVIKHIVSAIITVIIPRLTLYAGTEKFHPFFNKTLKILTTLIIPAMVGLFLLSDNVIEILGGVSFLPAANSLRILSLALGFSLLASLYASGVLLPNRQEKTFFIATLISALVNIVLNFVLIPILQQDAAALTTLVAEIIVLLICFHRAKQYAPVKNIRNALIPVSIGCLLIIAVCLGIKALKLPLLPETILSVAISMIMYCATQLALKNDSFVQIFYSVIGLFTRKST